MKYSEKWGKDVDEAVRLALEDLGATEDQIIVTVLEEPSKGFLGIGAKLAKVKVELLEEEPVIEKKSKKEGQKKPSENKHKRDLRKKNKPSSDNQNRSSRDNNRNSENKRSEARSDRKVREDSYPKIDISNKPVLSEKPDNLVNSPDSEAAEFLTGIMDKMGLDVNLESYKNEECFYIEVSGKDSRTVIGKRGQTLDSLQYLTNLVVNKEKEEYIRTIIDVEGYRSRREKTLEKLGIKLARKVQKTGRSVKLEPMNPYERKVIHSTLQGIDGITTRSEGEEPYRRVIVEKK